MSDHNNLRVEIKIPKKKQKATMYDPANLDNDID